MDPHLTKQEIEAVVEGKALPFEREHHRHYCEQCRVTARPPRIQAMEMTATRKEFTLTDESGYEFNIVANLDPQYGWSASVTFKTNGFKTDASAIDALYDSCLHFMRMMDVK